jgi:hypothetical protein
MVRPSLLEELVHQQTASSVSEATRLAIEPIGLEIAKETLPIR